MLDQIIANILNKDCKIVHLDLTEYKNELNLASLKRLRKALKLNNSIRKIIWPKNINALAQKIDADLQKKFKTFIPGSIAINRYNNPTYFHQIIENNAVEYANKTAVVNVDGKQITYRQLNEQANQLAYYLSKVIHLPKGSVLGLLLSRSINYIISIIACMKSGFIFVPIDTDSEKVSDERLDYYLKQGEVTHVISEDGQLNRFNKISTKPNVLLIAEILCNEKIINNTAAKNNPAVEIQPKDRSYIYFSSGSTGEPKGIPIEYGGLLNRIVAHIDVLALSQKDNGAQYATVAFDASLMEITMMLSVGGCLTIVPNEYRLDVRKTGNFYKDTKITVAIFVPSSLVVLDPKDFQHLRVVLSTGEPVSPTTIKRWREERSSSEPRKFINGYGDTEGTIAWTLGECIDNVHIGESIVGCHLYLLKKIKQEEINKIKNQIDVSHCVIEQKMPGNKIKYWHLCQNINDEGEIWLAGNGLTPGYLNKELNKKAFAEHQVLGRLYRTYNVAKYDIKGQCQIVDRKGRRLKIHGQFVEPKEIDNAIEKYNTQKVAKAFVTKRSYVLPDKPEYKRYHLIAYVEPRDGQKLDITELFKSLRSLPRYMIPARWVVMDKLPTNISGKIDRKKLSSDTSPFSMARFDNFTQPRDGMSGYEEHIHNIWCKLLSLEKHDISIHDDFFYLGGDSLLFMQMIDILKEEFSNKDLTQFQSVSTSTLAFNPTIAAISRFIRLDEQKFDFIDYSIRRENGDKSPLILIPPITGKLDAYNKFIERIPRDRPIIGLKYPGYQNIINMYESVEEHAQDCSNAIILFRNKHNVSGPILLFGYSSGGIIAYEIARILIAKNYKVYAFICDSIAPDFYQKANQDQIRKISDSLLHRFTNYFGVNPKNLVEALHDANESNYEYLSKELNRLLPQLKFQHKSHLDFIKKVKLAEINYKHDPIEDMFNESKIILLTANQTIESFVGDDKLYWSNCIDAAIKYEADHDNILEKITIDRSFYELLEEADNKIIYTWNIPSLLSGYIPRVELTSEITAFFSGKSFKESVFCTLSGDSGCGKTMLATNIINASTQYLQRLYFNASSARQLKTELLTFAKKQNIANITDKNIFHEIKIWLEEHPGGFLVLDNCNKEKLVDFIPSSGWHVLITTNLRQLKGHTISVKGMKKNEAYKLLSITGIAIDQGNRLANLVKYQPLYLRMVCAYLRSYQNEVRIKADELINYIESKHLSPEQIIFEVFGRFQILNSQAMKLLHELAYFNGSKVSHLLVKLLIASGDAIKEDNQFLSITNFLKENDLIHEMSAESIYIHPKLQALLKEVSKANSVNTGKMSLLDEIDSGDSLKLQTNKLNNHCLMSICQKLLAVYPFEKTERCYYEFCKQLKPHLKMLLSEAMSDNIYQVKILRMLADSYQANGKYFKQILSINKAKNIVESEGYKKLRNNYEANILKAFVYKDFVKLHFSAEEQLRYINLLIDAKTIFESPYKGLTRTDEAAKIEILLNFILSQMAKPQRNNIKEYIDYLLSIIPRESFESASILRMVFSTYPKNNRIIILHNACRIYENFDDKHPDLPLMYKQLYMLKGNLSDEQTESLEKAINILAEVSDFSQINIDILSIYTLLVNDYYNRYSQGSLRYIGVKIDKSNQNVKLFKNVIKKIQNNLIKFAKDNLLRKLLPKVLYQEEKLKNGNIKFHNHESVKNNAFNKSLLKIIKSIQQYCINILGKPPCEFVIIVLGSLSYGLAIKGSDLEYSVIISPGHDHISRQFIDNYFQCFLPLFESFFKIAFANIGCRIDRSVSPHIKYDKTQKKYNIKGFYGSPNDILDKHCRLTSKTSNKDKDSNNEGASKVSLYQLLNPLYLIGDQDLYQNFLYNLYKRLQLNINYEPFYRVYAEEQLELHNKEFNEAHKDYYEQFKSIDNLSPLAIDKKREHLSRVKKLIAHPLVFMVFDIALYSNILIENGRTYRSIFELISCLQSKSILSKPHSNGFEKALCDVTIIRNKINEDTYNGVSLIRDNKILLRICDEVLSEFSKNREWIINSKLSDEESDEQYEDKFNGEYLEKTDSPRTLISSLQQSSYQESLSIETKLNNTNTLEGDTNPLLSIYMHAENFAGYKSRQTAGMQLSTPIKQVNTSLGQTIESPLDISPSTIKKAGIDEIFNGDDEYFSSDEGSYQEDDEYEIKNNDVEDDWDIDEEDIYLKQKRNQKF